MCTHCGCALLKNPELRSTYQSLLLLLVQLSSLSHVYRAVGVDCPTVAAESLCAAFCSMCHVLTMLCRAVPCHAVLQLPSMAVPRVLPTLGAWLPPTCCVATTLWCIGTPLTGTHSGPALRHSLWTCGRSVRAVFSSGGWAQNSVS